VRHAAAVVFSFFPAIARMVAIKLGDPTYVSPDHFNALYNDATQGVSELAVISVLGNGFIITSMVWASFVVAMIENKPRQAAWIALLGGALTLFGVIHSVMPAGNLYLPWALAPALRSMALQFAGAYLALAAVLLLFSFWRGERGPAHA
jgi:AGZA family xanthine/uracil permease-like MFS transporter